MKKALASALALTMIAGMTSVGFATTATADKDATDLEVTNNFYLVDKDNEEILVPATGDLKVKPGESIYVELMGKEEGSHITSKLANQSKVVLDWNQGKELVESTGITNKKVSHPGSKLVANSPKYNLEKSYENQAALDAAIANVRVHNDAAHTDGSATEGCTDQGHMIPLSDEQIAAVKSDFKNEQKTSYKYMAEIKLKHSFTAKENDLLGTLKAMKKSVSNNSTDVKSVSVNAVVGYDQMDANHDLDVKNERPVVTFEDMTEDAELLFSTTASFTVNVKGQGDLYLGYSLKPVADIVNQNENANIDFISFEAKPSFNRIGTMRLFGTEGKFVYELTGNGLKKIEAKYDEDYEAYAFETRTLGSYLVSDVELKYTHIDNGDSSSSSSSSSDASSSSSSSQGGNSGNGGNSNNPNTGASSMAGVAMGLAGISLVAGVVAKKSSKK